MILQNIVFPKKEVCSETELYYRKIGIPSSDFINGKLVFKKGQRVNFDTYFNCFSLLKWYKYTSVQNVQLVLKLKGSFKVKLIHISLKDGGVLDYRILSKQNVVSDEAKELRFDYYTDFPWGLLTFGLEAVADGSVCYGGYYSSDIESANIHNVKIGIGICTFKRESYIHNNMSNLCSDILNNQNSPIKDKVEVFISDNAQTLDPGTFNSDKIHIFKNKNTGGSGGFTRTMIEVNNANEQGAGFTHILLMDDDVTFDPESIFRTYSVLALLKPEYVDSFVGGAMFRTDMQYLQHASGEYWHGERCESFITTYNSRRDMRNLKDIAENENLTDANYQAWWFCAIPMTICRKDNLGLPLFIKSDDIEYSIRNLKNLILLNGINVWHESFESKYSASNEYYTVRNYLITSSIHGVGLTPDDIKRYVKNYFYHYLVNFKYLEIKLFFDAIDDFLKGVDYLKFIDLESYHKKIMQNSYKIVDVKDLSLPFSKELYERTLNTPYPKSNLKRLFRIITLNGLLLPSNKVVALGMWGGSNIQTYRAKYIIRYEPTTNKGFVLKRSLKKFVASFRRYKKINKKIDKYFVKARDEFMARAKELENADFWATKL